MPFKRNPINSEKINSLCRFIAAQVEVLWHNSASMVLERTLDDSANRRIVIAEMFLAMEEVLITAKRLVAHMNFHTPAIELNVQRYGTFAASELLLMALGRKGADRQLMHEVIREHSLNSWAEVQSGKENTLALALAKDKRILAFLETEQVLALMQPDSYVGNAQEKTLHICSRIEKLE
jgi:adenylosuccinate lyase